MPVASSGTATFLFTDVEGSTRLLKELRERYGAVLAEHQRILREAFAAHGGEEVAVPLDATGMSGTYLLRLPSVKRAPERGARAAGSRARSTRGNRRRSLCAGGDLRVRVGAVQRHVRGAGSGDRPCPRRPVRGAARGKGVGRGPPRRRGFVPRLAAPPHALSCAGGREPTGWSVPKRRSTWPPSLFQYVQQRQSPRDVRAVPLGQAKNPEKGREAREIPCTDRRDRARGHVGRARLDERRHCGNTQRGGGNIGGGRQAAGRPERQGVEEQVRRAEDHVHR